MKFYIISIFFIIGCNSSEDIDISSIINIEDALESYYYLHDTFPSNKKEFEKHLDTLNNFVRLDFFHSKKYFIKSHNNECNFISSNNMKSFLKVNILEKDVINKKFTHISIFPYNRIKYEHYKYEIQYNKIEYLPLQYSFDECYFLIMENKIGNFYKKALKPKYIELLIIKNEKDINVKIHQSSIKITNEIMNSIQCFSENLQNKGTLNNIDYMYFTLKIFEENQLVFFD